MSFQLLQSETPEVSKAQEYGIGKAVQEADP